MLHVCALSSSTKFHNAMISHKLLLGSPHPVYCSVRGFRVFPQTHYVTKPKVARPIFDNESIQEEQEEDHSIMPREDLPRYSRQNYSYLDAQLEAEHGIDEEADSNLDFTNTQQLRTSLDSIMWKALVKGDYNEWYKSSRLFKAHNLPMDETSYSLLAHGYILSHRHMASSALMVLQEMKEADMHPALVKLNERFIHGYLELQDLGLTPEKTAWQTVLRTCWQCAVRLKRKRLQRIKNYLKDRVHVEDMYQLDRSDVRALISAEHEQARLLIAAHEAQVCGKVDATMLDRKEIKEIAIEKAELLAPPAHGRKHTRKPIYRQINEQRALRDRVSSHIPDPDYFTEGRYTDSNMGLQEGLEPDVLEDNEDDESNNPHVFYCHSVYPYLMRLDCEIFRYLSKEDLRVLQALEVGHKNHELVPLQLVESIAGLKRGGCYKTLQNLLKHKLVAHDGKTYDGYKLTYNGYDFLALRTLMSRGNIAGVGQRVGVGKESDIHICTDDEGRQLVIKFHRLGRVSFKTVKENRDYLQHRQSASWMYLARLAAAKEFAYLTELYNAGFPVPEPVGHNRHAIVMEYLDDAVCMCQIRKLDKPQLLLEKCMEELKNGSRRAVAKSRPRLRCLELLIRTLLGAYVLPVKWSLLLSIAQSGVIHGDFNEFNLLIRTVRIDPLDELSEVEDYEVYVIDFPQVLSVEHPDAKRIFERDVNCIATYFAKNHKYVVDTVPSFEEDVLPVYRAKTKVEGINLDSVLSEGEDKLLMDSCAAFAELDEEECPELTEADESLESLLAELQNDTVANKESAGEGKEEDDAEADEDQGSTASEWEDREEKRRVIKSQNHVLRKQRRKPQEKDVRAKVNRQLRTKNKAKPNVQKSRDARQNQREIKESSSLGSWL